MNRESIADIAFVLGALLIVTGIYVMWGVGPTLLASGVLSMVVGVILAKLWEGDDAGP